MAKKKVAKKSAKPAVKLGAPKKEAKAKPAANARSRKRKVVPYAAKDQLEVLRRRGAGFTEHYLHNKSTKNKIKAMVDITLGGSTTRATYTLEPGEEVRISFVADGGGIATHKIVDAAYVP